MTASPREIAAFWFGFGVALRGAFGDAVTDGPAAQIITSRIPISDEDLLFLIAELPGPADDELRAMVKALGGAGE